MITNTGYRQMLRDRTPKTVILALKWCRTLEAWLDHVYKTRIWIYCSNKERLAETKRILNRKGKFTEEWFADTIDWQNLTQADKAHWENVKAWVSWFQQTYQYVENAYDISKKVGKSIEEIKLDIMSTYLRSMCPTTEDNEKEKERKNKNVNSFADFLIKSFENRL